MKTIFSKMNLNLKVGTSVGAALLFALVLGLSLAPRVLNQIHAEPLNCSKIFTEAQFNPYPVTWNDTAGATPGSSDCYDFAAISGNVTGTGFYAPSFSAHAGDTILMRIYVHNGAAFNSGVAMEGVSVNTNIDYNSGFISTTLSADGIASRTDNVSISLDPGTHLELIPNPSNLPGPSDPNPYIGHLDPCFDASKQFYFSLKVVGPAAPTGQNTITASSGGQIGSQCLRTGTVNWTNSSDVSSVEVTVEDTTANNNTVNTITGTGGSPNSSSETPWLNPGHSYQFILYNTTSGQHAEVARTTESVPSLDCGGSPGNPASGNITATLGGQVSGQCLYRATVNWSTQNVTSAIVTVSDPSKNSDNFYDNDKIYSADLNNSASDAPWIAPGTGYRFTLWSIGTGSETHTFFTTGGTQTYSNVQRLSESWVSGGAALSCGATTYPPVACSPTPQTVTVGQPVNWLVSGGDGTYTTSITDNVAISRSYGTGIFTATFNTPGAKSVTFTSAGTSATCQTQVNAVPVNPSLTCTTITPSVEIGKSASFQANVSNISGGLTWYVDNVQASGSSAGFSTSFNSAGSHNVRVTGGGLSANCQAVNVTQPATTTTTTTTTTTPPPTAAICSSTGPQGFTTTATSGTKEFFAYGVQNATAVNFAAYHDGQADLVWYPGANLGGGTWKGVIDLAKHPGNGLIHVDVWMIGATGSVGCGSANFTRTAIVTSSAAICSSTGPQGFTTTATSGTKEFFAYGVQNATAVNFAAYHDGQADLVWYPGANLGGGTWKGVIDLAKHPGNGLIHVDVWMIGATGSVGCGSANFTRTTETPVCVADSNPALNGSTPSKQGSTYTSVISWSFTGSNQIKITQINPGSTNENQIVLSTLNNGNQTVTGLLPGSPYIFKMYDTNPDCGKFLASTQVQTPANPGQLVCFAASSNINSGTAAGFSVTGGTAPYSWSGDGNPASGSGSSFNPTYSNTTQNPVTHIVSVSSSDGQPSVQCNVIVSGTPASPTGGTGDCNNSSNSCNTNNNNNNQVSTGNNSSNQNNQNNINGNNNVVTNTNNNCVNNSCNTNVVYITTGGSVVPANRFSQLSITKNVRNMNGGAFQNSVSANNNDTVQFEITVANSGNATANNVRVTDSLPSGLSLVFGTVQVDGSSVSDGNLYNGMFLGSLSAGQRVRVLFQARVNSNGGSSIQNIASASSDNAGNVQASAWVFVNSGSVQGGNVSLTYSKRAVNETKNADAASVIAGREDFITYTLTAANTGNTPANNFVISDDLSQVLPYADMVDNGGGSLNGNTIIYPGLTVPAGGSVSRSFKVRVKFALASNLSYVMTNTYGNTVTVRINTPQVLGAFVAPKTGADTMGLIFSGVLTAAAAVFRKRKDILKLIFT